MRFTFWPKVTRTYVLVPMLVAVTILSACSSEYAQEENLVRQYFRASGLGDNQTLTNFAIVNFDRATEGTVTDFDIVTVTPEQVTPLQILTLSKALADAEAANKEFSDRKRAYQDANIDAINRVLKAEAAGGKLTGKDAAIQAEWTKWRDDTITEAKKVSAARAEFMAARPVAEVSLSSPNGEAPPLAELDGNLVSKDVTIAATVRAPDGSSSQKNLVVTVQRAIVKGPSGDRTGKWVVASVKPA
jgi:hypothetical protein